MFVVAAVAAFISLWIKAEYYENKYNEIHEQLNYTENLLNDTVSTLERLEAATVEFTTEANKAAKDSNERYEQIYKDSDDWRACMLPDGVRNAFKECTAADTPGGATNPLQPSASGIPVH